MRPHISFDAYADTYAAGRAAAPWVLAPLREAVAALPLDGAVVEIGCGTGNYVIALAAALPERRYFGFDVAQAMVQLAQRRRPSVCFVIGQAGAAFPFKSAAFAFAFAVDVVHHVQDLDGFFAEAARVLVPGGRMMIVTDSEDDIRERSLTRCFPETLESELGRYPTLAALEAAAAASGLSLCGRDAAEGRIPLTAEFVAGLEGKCFSALRLISDQAHGRGLARAREALKGRADWESRYTLLSFEKA